MRPQLELTELIDKYLRNELSPADKAAFEQRMATNAELQEQVQLQREVMKGIERAALKQRAQDAWKQYNSGQNLWKWGLSTIAVLVVAAAVLFYASNSNRNSLPDLNENGEKVWADADKYLPSQKFTIDAQKDTVIVTEAGIVFAVPANVFLDASGHPVSGEIELEVKEAMDAASMAKAGLSTKSGDQMLETGGMFYMNARKDGNSLKIDESKGVYAEVPAKEKKEDMMLFHGQRMPDGSIDWQSPKPLEKFLTPVDITSLDFYPPSYLDSLGAMGYDIANKKFTDSLYYSFAWEEKRFQPVGSPQAQSESLTDSSTTTVLSLLSYSSEESDLHGINPAKVHAIWDSEFDNTLLSTKEFEARMPYIHRTCNNAVLEMYINNLDKKMCTVDSMAASIAGDLKFYEFAKHGDGRVKSNTGHFQKLKEYYTRRAKAMAQAVAATKKKFWSQQADLDNEAMNKQYEHDADETTRKENNINEEFNTNLEEAYRQLGYTKPSNINVPVGDYTYNATITITGWNNIDKYVMESVISRTTLDYTDPKTGKKAVIKYQPVTITIAEYEKYDRVYVYLLPDQLSSFMRVNGSNGKFEEKLNELMKYKLFCVAYKGDDAYVYSPAPVYPQSYDNLALMKTDDETVTKMLSTESVGSNIPQQRDIIKEIEYNVFARKEGQRQQKLSDIRQLHDRIEPVIFPCGAVDCSNSDAAAANGLKLFKQNCAVCHSTGTNVVTGPGLAGVEKRAPSNEWLHKFIKNPSDMKKSGDPFALKVDKEFPSADMTVFTFLSDKEIDDIISYLSCPSLNTPGPVANSEAYQK